MSKTRSKRSMQSMQSMWPIWRMRSAIRYTMKMRDRLREGC